jgi:large subunit ribosomal protein L1
MANRGKKYLEAAKKVEREKTYSLTEAAELLKETGTAKFDETADIAIKLGVDPRKAEQMVRGTVLLPHGTGKEVKILVFAKGEKEQEARDAGADFVGADDMVEKVKGGWLDFDKAVATPDMMGVVGKVARVLGPRGLMPNPKVGTVTFDLKETIGDLKKGKVEFKTEKGGILHVPVGRVSFDKEKLCENIQALLDTVNKLKPLSSKGQYLENIVLSSTMGPGIKIDVAAVK